MSILALNRLDIFLLIAVFILIAIPVIFSISANAGKNNKTSEEPPVQVNLFISPYYEIIFGKEMTGNLLLEFGSQYPEILIRTADDTQEPDILVFDEGSFNAFADWDMLADLNTFASHEYIEEFSSGEFPASSAKGIAGHGTDAGSRRLAVPLVSFMDLLFYNIDILTAAGFDSPPKTREEFTAYSRIVAGSNFGVSASAISLSRNDRNALARDIFSWIWAGGSNFWINGEKPSLNTRTIVNDFNFFGVLNREGMLAPGVFETTGQKRLEDFAAGKIAMMAAPAQVIPFLRERMNEGSFGITSIPDANTGGRYSTGISSIYAAISANCEYTDEAWSFLVYLTEKSPLLCEALKAVPGKVSNLIPGDYVRDDPYYSKAWEIFEFAQIAEGFSGKPYAEEYESVFLEELQTFFESSRTAQQTVNAIQRRWDEISGNF